MASIFGARVAPVLFLLLALGGCSVPPDTMPPIPDSAPSVYRLGPGDQVRIITVGEEVLTGQFHLDADGTVDIPLLGPVKAGGLTASELGLSIAAELRTGRAYKDPSVSAEVIAYRPLAILGEVNRPGQYPYQPDMSVVTAIAAAGGFTYRAIDDRFAITRSIDGRMVDGRAEPRTKVQPGDVITVYERLF